MKQVLKKLRAKKGETLVEILVAVLIIALAAALFATMYSAAGNINMEAQKQDKQLYDAVSELEKKTTTDKNKKGNGTVTFSGDGITGGKADVGVELYTEDGLYSYKTQEGTP